MMIDRALYGRASLTTRLRRHLERLYAAATDYRQVRIGARRQCL